MDEKPEITPETEARTPAHPATEPHVPAAAPQSAQLPPTNPQMVPPTIQQPMHNATPPSPYTKTPGLAAFLSVVPGLGNIYNGLYLRGVAFFLTYVSLFSLAVQTADRSNEESEMAFLIPSIIFFWFFNIFDAYRQAMLINYRETYQQGATKVEEPPASGGFVAGVIVFLVGLYGTLRKYFDIDMAWLLDLWPFALMALGAYLIFDQVRGQRQNNLSSDDEF